MYFALTLAHNHKQDDVEHVLAGRWGYGEDYIRDKVKEIARCIQSIEVDRIGPYIIPRG